MRVCFPLIKTNSGTDFWTFNLARVLRIWGVETIVHCYPQRYQFFPYLLRRESRRIRADIIHTNSWNGFVFKGDAPLVVTEHHIVHDQVLDRYKSLAQKLFHKLVYRFERESFAVAEQITCVSEHTKRRLKEVFGVEAVRIYNGVDVERFSPKKVENLLMTEKGKTVLLFVGNMSRRKGTDLLVRIMERLGDRFVLLCVSARRRGIARIGANIHIIGNLPQDKMLDYYNYCDIFVFPSRSEGLSCALIEAMACAKPVVATDCSSIGEVVIQEKGGFLCEMDNIEEFAEKIRILAQDSLLRKRMGLFNRERVERHFSLTQMGENYYALYKSLSGK